MKQHTSSNDFGRRTSSEAAFPVSDPNTADDSGIFCNCSVGETCDHCTCACGATLLDDGQCYACEVSKHEQDDELCAAFESYFGHDYRGRYIDREDE